MRGQQLEGAREAGQGREGHLLCSAGAGGESPHIRTHTRRPMCTPFYASVHFNTVRKQSGPSVGDQEEIASHLGEVGASCWEEGVKTTRVDPV